MLAHDIVELEHAVGCMGRHRQLARVRLLAGAAQKLNARCFHLPRRENSAHPTFGRSVVTLNPFQGSLKSFQSLLIVANPFEPAFFVTNPATTVIAGSQISACAKPHHFRKQRVLNAFLAAEFDESRHAIAQQFGNRERRIQLEGGVRSGIAVLEVTRIAFHDLALFRNADFEERLAIVHWPAGIGDQPMRGAVAGMDVRVDETGSDKLTGGVDRRVGMPVERLADVDDPVALVNDDAVLDQPMAAGLVANNPARSDQGPHRRSIEF